MRTLEIVAVYDLHHIDRDNIGNRDFATERDSARYELHMGGVTLEDICDFEFNYYGKPRNLSDVKQSIRRHRERLQGGNDAHP